MRDLQKIYTDRYRTALVPVAEALANNLTTILKGASHIDRIAARAKSIDRFLAKADKKEGDALKYSDPLNQIQDQVGARVITFFKSDVDPVAGHLLEEFRPIESKDVIPQHEWEFGYFGRHYILLMPTDLFAFADNKDDVPPVFELQIKTLFQHAWSEAEHDLGYKPGEVPLEPDDERLLAFTSAQAWGADRIFDDLSQKRTKTEDN